MEVRRDVNREFSSVQEFVSEYITNVSRSGVFVRSDDPLPVGTRVNLKFSVVVDDLEIIEGVGEVVRVVVPGGHEVPGMGVQFIELSEPSRLLIERIIAKR